MSIKVIIENATAGERLHVNSEKRPDAYAFTRNPACWREHELVFPSAEAFNAVSRDLMLAPGNPPMHVLIAPEPAGTDAAGSVSLAEVEELRKQVAKLHQENERLWKEADTAWAAARAAELSKKGAQ
jgi:hypothetical protein